MNFFFVGLWGISVLLHQIHFTFPSTAVVLYLPENPNCEYTVGWSVFLEDPGKPLRWFMGRRHHLERLERQHARGLVRSMYVWDAAETAKGGCSRGGDDAKALWLLPPQIGSQRPQVTEACTSKLQELCLLGLPCLQVQATRTKLKLA